MTNQRLPLPASGHLHTFRAEHKLRRDMAICAYDGDVITVVCQYLREVLEDYGDQGKVATKLVDIIEGVVS